MINVLTVTCRHEGILLVQHCLKQQTYQGFNWIIVDKDYDIGWFSKNIDFPKAIYVPEKAQKPKRKYGVCNALNTGLMYADAEILVQIQDWHWFDRQTLERFFYFHERFPYALCSHGYKIVSFKNYEKCFGEFREEDLEIIDPTIRYKKGLPIYAAYPPYLGWEMNISSVPMDIMDMIGGWDEALDDGYQQDPHWISIQAMLMGSPVFIDCRGKAYSFEHKLNKDGVIERPPDWEMDSAKNSLYLTVCFRKEIDEWLEANPMRGYSISEADSDR